MSDATDGGAGQKSDRSMVPAPLSVSFGDFFIGCGDFDLLGDPVQPAIGRAGRPRHIPTEKTRNEVSCLAGFGKRQDEIAAAIGITPPTLRMNYFNELGSRSMAARKRAERDAERLRASNGGHADERD